MNSADFSMIIGIFVIFFVLFTSTILFENVQKIKNNWPMYRCHPGIMPFASQFGHNTSENLGYCIQNIQSASVQRALLPLQHMASTTTDSLGSLGDSMQSSRNMTSFSRSIFGFMGTGIFGMFGNVLVVMQELANVVTAIVGSIMGIMYTLIHIMKGTELTMAALWNGAPGKLLKVFA